MSPNVVQPFKICILGGLGFHIQSILYPLLELLFEADLPLCVVVAAVFDDVFMWLVQGVLIVQHEKLRVLLLLIILVILLPIWWVPYLTVGNVVAR